MTPRCTGGVQYIERSKMGLQDNLEETPISLNFKKRPLASTAHAINHHKRRKRFVGLETAREPCVGRDQIEGNPHARTSLDVARLA
jgi:hypothetical protein